MKWDEFESSPLVLDDWQRNGSNYDNLEPGYFQGSEEAVKLVAGICSQCGSQYTVNFKRKALRFSVEYFRVCGSCYEVYSYELDNDELVVRLYESFASSEVIGRHVAVKFQGELISPETYLNDGDYIAGFEYYGDTIQYVQGWFKESDTSFGFHIQADDKWSGGRDTTIVKELGPTRRLPPKVNPYS